jgi:hypothetical protein
MIDRTGVRRVGVRKSSRTNVARLVGGQTTLEILQIGCPLLRQSTIVAVDLTDRGVGLTVSCHRLAENGTLCSLGLWPVTP